MALKEATNKSTAAKASKRAVERHLKALVGLGLFEVWLACDMLVLDFGRRQRRWKKNFITRRKRLITPAVLALHIQCPWRMEFNEVLFAERYDHWKPPGADRARKPNWKWDYEKKGSLLLEELKRLRRAHPYKNVKRRLVVMSVAADARGGATLRLSHEFRIVITPRGSGDEAWRLFGPCGTERHFVVNDDGGSYRI